MKGLVSMAMGGPDSVSREEILAHNLLLHERTAEQYDRIHFYLRNHIEQASLRRDLALVHRYLEKAVSGAVHYLDLGCGTGNLVLKLLSMGGIVVGLDLSPTMIDVLNQKVAQAGHEERFRGFVGSADDLTSVKDVKAVMPNIHAICVSSVLHHLHDYLAPFQHIREACPSLQAVFITHEPCERDSLVPPGQIRRAYNGALRQLDVLLSNRIRRPVEGSHDDPVADYHAFKNGIDQREIERILKTQGFNKTLIDRRYNMRRTTLASAIDNIFVRILRNDIFPITMFTLAVVRSDSG